MKAFWILTFALCSAKHQDEDETETRIFRGDDVRPDSYPANVVIGKCVGGHLTHRYCGGTLISDRSVLTAAHCIIELPFVDLIFGAYYLDLNERGVVTYKVGRENFKVHEGFGYTLARFPKNDIAIIHLPPNIKWAENIAVAELFQSRVWAADTGMIIGYSNFKASARNVLQESLSMVMAKVQYLNFMGHVLKDRDFLEKMRRFMTSIYPEKARLDDNAFKTVMRELFADGFSENEVFFARSLREASVELGEFGGPFMVKGTGRIGGVASVTCGNVHKEGDPRVMVFTRISYYLDWIKLNMK